MKKIALLHFIQIIIILFVYNLLGNEKNNQLDTVNILGHKVRKVIKLYESNNNQQLTRFLKECSDIPHNNKILLVFETLPDEKQNLLNYLESHQMEILSKLGNEIPVRMSIDEIVKVTNDSIVKFRLLRFPHSVVLNEDFDNQAIKQTLANQYVTSESGKNLKIGIIDLDFEGYNNLLMNDEVPTNVELISFPDDYEGNNSVHGAKCLEVIYDYLPAAEYYLVRLKSVDFLDEALNWLQEKQVKLVSMSIGWPGVNLGLISDDVVAIKSFVNQGGIIVNASGNYQKKHWMGVFQDQNNDSFNDFAGGEKENFLKFKVNEKDKVSFFLNWSENGNVYGTEQYRIIIFDEDFNEIKREPEDDNTYGSVTLEFETELNPGYYYLKIQHVNGSPENQLHLWIVKPTEIEENLQVPQKSLNPQAAVSEAISVGAVYYFNEKITDYSSFGPAFNTNETKPDFVAHSEVKIKNPNSPDSPIIFRGTSAATPNLAGLIGILLSSNQNNLYLSRDEIVEQLNNLSIDKGIEGKDNVFGFGLPILNDLGKEDGWENVPQNVDFSLLKDGIIRRNFHTGDEKDSNNVNFSDFQNAKLVAEIVNSEIKDYIYIGFSENKDSEPLEKSLGRIQFDIPKLGFQFQKLFAELTDFSHSGEDTKYELKFEAPPIYLIYPNEGEIVSGAFPIKTTLNKGDKGYIFLKKNIKYIQFQYSTDHENWYDFSQIDGNQYDASIDGYRTILDSKTLGLENEPQVWVRCRVIDNYDQKHIWYESDQPFSIINPFLSAGTVEPSIPTNKDSLQFKVTYTGAKAPDDGSIRAHVLNGPSYILQGTGNDYENGVVFESEELTYNPGTYSYYFTCTVNGEQLRFPENSSEYLTLVVNQSVKGWDLMVNDLSLNRSTLRPGDTFSATAEIRNNSDPGNTYTNVILKFEFIDPQGNVIDVNEYTINSISPGQHQEYSTYFTVSGNAEEGNYSVYVSVSVKDEVSQNNIQSQSIAVTNSEIEKQYLFLKNYQFKQMGVNDITQFNGSEYKVTGINSSNWSAVVQRISGDQHTI
ncbi:MAG: S8 family serine peptidase, partial [Promethearchaeota archaeon]